MQPACHTGGKDMRGCLAVLCGAIIAFAALEDVYNAHSNFVGYFKIDPQLNPLRDDPRFKALLKKSGFPE